MGIATAALASAGAESPSRRPCNHDRSGDLDGTQARMQRSSPYLLMLTSTVWKLTGPTWRGIDHLLGVMFGVQQLFHADVVEGIYAAAETLKGS